MTIELSEEDRIKIINSDDIYKIMQDVLLRENKIDRDKEHFWVAGLAVNNALLFIELISLGSQTVTVVEPMDVFSIALQKRSTNIILIHNHPSGELMPSETDKDVTDRLMVVGKIVHTPVIDHLVISEKGYSSFDKTGLMKELAKSRKFLPSFMLEDEIRKKIADKVEKKRSLEIAREMKREKVAEESIAKYTGLTVEDIRAIEV